MSIEMVPIASSRVSEIGFDGDTGTVFVRFTDGALWQYRNVPDHVYQEFFESPSKGRFIAQVLDNYDKGPV